MVNNQNAVERFLEKLASAEPTPGGGAAAAAAGAMGCALAEMAVGTTLKRKNLDPEVRAKLEKSAARLHSFRSELQGYIQKDAEAYTGYLTAIKLPKELPAREQTVQDALVFAAKVPADSAKAALYCLREVDAVKDMVAPAIVADVFCARHLLQACIKCAVENIRANLVYIKNTDKTLELEKQISTFLKSC